MNKDTLSHLGLTPDQTIHVTGKRRTRLLNFLLRWTEYQAALACLEEMLALKPDLVGLLDAQAQALLGLGQPDAALVVMQTRHQIRTSLSSRALQARIHLASDDVKTALSIAYDLVAENAASVTAWALLGQAHLAQGDSDAALTAYRRLAELNPNSRAYLLGMLDFHQDRDNAVIASGYAVRLQRAVAEGQSLPAATLRRLRDYYQASGEINRVQDIQSELNVLYQTELTALEATLADDLRVLARRPPLDPPLKAEEALPKGEQEGLGTIIIPVSDQERQRIQNAAHDLFGYDALLPGQTETMAAALRGEDVLTILPTGGGKSLCYQLPALLDECGITLVISPLIALMKDQVDSLPPDVRRRATTINSSLGIDELRRRMHRTTQGDYQLVYAAPERLRQPPFLHALRRAKVNRLVIDEAHCVSVWGHNFRPDYLTIAQAREALGNPPLLAMTATAPPRVRRDILQRLSGREIAVVTADTFRPNLYLEAISVRNNDDKLRHLLEICQTESGSGIVYAGTRERCERIAAMLSAQGISAGYYHAGIGDRVARAAAQDTFMNGAVRVMVATVAFGMGIDKSNIRFIVHFQLPPSLEAYYQQAGRAGRDGLPARCTLLYSSADRATLTRRAKRDALPVELLRAVYTAVKRRLGGATLGRVASGDLGRDTQAEQTPVRVALSMLEEAGLLRRHHDAPATAVTRLRDGRLDENCAAFVAAARLRAGQSLSLDPVAVAQQARLDPLEIESQLLAWAAAGWLDYSPSGRDWLLEMLPPPADAAAQVQMLIDRYATIQAQRVDEIAAYAATLRCRHGHIRAYLSGQPLDECRVCDNCQPRATGAASAAVPDEQEQLLTVLRCLDDAPGGWGRNNLCYILHGAARASERGRQSPHWGTLGFRSRAAVEGLVERLIHANLLNPRQLSHGGVVLELTLSGRAALENPLQLSPLVVESPTPAPLATSEDEESDVDEALLARLRAWRLETARLTQSPPYMIAHNALLRRIAAVCPQNENALLTIKGMGPKKMAQYGAAILALVREKAN